LIYCLSGTVSANKENSEKVVLHSIPLSNSNAKLIENKVFVRSNILLEMGATISWKPLEGSGGVGYIEVSFPTTLFGEPISVKKSTIKIKIVNNYKTGYQLQCYNVNKIEYYTLLYGPIDSRHFWISIRSVLEPLFKIGWDQEKKIVLIYNEVYFYRTKLLSESSEVIINYELHKLKRGLIKQNKEVFVPLREFIELMKGEITYSPISEFNSPEIIIKPTNINKEIKLYPQIDKAILISNDSKEKREIILTKKIINRNGSYFIGVNDLILLLQAEKHIYLDSDVNIYFNFEF